jgi:hypothetical protein
MSNDKEAAKATLAAMAEQFRRAGLAVPDTSRYMAMLDENSDSEEESEGSWEDEDEEVEDENLEEESDIDEDDDKRIEFRQTPDKGVAAFALKDIPRGTRLLTEKPLLNIITVDGKYDPLPNFERWKKLPQQDQDDYASLHAIEHVRQEILETLIPQGQEGMSFILANQIANLGAVYAANGFGESVYKYASRINHSCTPNCNQSPTDDEMRFHAVRDIKAGEELSVYYVDPELPQQNRQRKLDDYDFLCKCAACDLTTVDGMRGEKRRTQMWRLNRDIEFLKERLGLDGSKGVKGPFAPSVSTKQGNPDPENALRVLESLCKKEGLVGNNLTAW